MSVILLLFISHLTIISSAQENKLKIRIWDNQLDSYIKKDFEEDTIFLFEGYSYDIDVTYYNETKGVDEFVFDATIILPWGSYSYTYISDISYPPTISAPLYEEYPQFIIEATRDGYISGEQDIIILKGILDITTNSDVVDEESSFSVSVSDENSGASLQNVDIFLQDKNNNTIASAKTNQDGKAYLTAPSVTKDSDITIISWKDGYKDDSTSIRIMNIGTGFFDKSVAPIVMAVIVVIFAIVFVKIRKGRGKKYPLTEEPIKPSTIVKEAQKKEQLKHRKEPPSPVKEDVSSLEKGPRVEEIRIHGNKKKKETEYLQDEKKPIKTDPEIKRKGYDWFEGEEYMRYRIDELTGEIDPKKGDKWFEGVDDIKFKVDEKLREKHKKKKKD